MAKKNKTDTTRLSPEMTKKKSPDQSDRSHDKLFVLQGTYRVDRILEQLHYSKVYLAKDLEKEEIEYAIKEVPIRSELNSLSSPEMRTFSELAQEYMNLYHPYLTRVVDFFFEDGYEYIVMSYVKGRRLQEVIDVRKAPFKENDVLDIGLMIASALNYMHTDKKKPVFFSDVFPSNVIITPLRGIEMTDYGLGKFLADRGQEYPYRGTPGFAAPEQHYPHDIIDAQTDIYALGAVMFYMATNIHPEYIRERLPDVRKINPDISEKLANAIYKATEPDRRKRYKVIRHLIEDLVNYDSISNGMDLSGVDKLRLWFSNLINRKKIDI